MFVLGWCLGSPTDYFCRIFFSRVLTVNFSGRKHATIA